MGWFDSTLKHGDGKPCAVRAGNDVQELIDGVDAMKAMAGAIQDTRSNEHVLWNGGATVTEPRVPGVTGCIVEGRDHNIYFTTSSGGATNHGAIVKITPDGKTVSVQCSFDFKNGADPRGLTVGKDGTLYGVCYGGGMFGTGTVWSLAPGGTAPNVLWNFRNGAPLVTNRPQTKQEQMDAAGSYPTTPPVIGTDGNLYGVTTYANNQQAGVLYRIAGGNFKALYQFNAKDAPQIGYLPGTLIAGADGNLYGTTVKGGLGWGTVFKATASGGISSIHRFDYVQGQGAVYITEGHDRKLYGTASSGGTAPFGLVYRLTEDGSDFTVLHTFKGTDGAAPVAGVCEDDHDHLYGVTRGGGAFAGRGAVYRLDTSGDNFFVVHSLAGSMLEGRYPATTMLLHSNGDLFGVTPDGGTGVSGVVYSVDLHHPDFAYALNWWFDDVFPLYAPNAPSVGVLLKGASDRGAQVRAMLWDREQAVNDHPLQNRAETGRITALDNGAGIFDDRTLEAGAHHQKILVLTNKDGLVAFCGGVDFNADRVWPVANDKGSPLHDVHCRIKGPAAADLLDTFTQRWMDHPDHIDLDQKKVHLAVHIPADVPPPVPGAHCWVQVGRTFGNGTKHTMRSGKPYAFAPNGEQTAAQMILYAIFHAQKFIYVEDQYFVDTTDPKKPGPLNVRVALMSRLQQPGFQHLTIVLPDSTISDLPQVAYRRQQLIAALKSAGMLPGGGNKVRVFYRKPPGAGHTYVHAKVWIFDDQFAVIGSANTNRRSWTHDSEVAVGICDQGDGTGYLLPHRLRMRLWAEHLNLWKTVNRQLVPDERLANPLAQPDPWVNLPAAALVAPYDENAHIDTVSSGGKVRAAINAAEQKAADLAWDTTLDPDGS
jgi:uncharacterized repeat protein (TIGR03803 family)